MASPHPTWPELVEFELTIRARPHESGVQPSGPNACARDCSRRDTTTRWTTASRRFPAPRSRCTTRV